MIGRPGYPQMRFWPDQARHFFGHYEDLGFVHPGYSKRRVPVGQGGFGEFRAAPLPLRCIYLPERQEGAALTITPVPRGEAVIELLRHSVAAHIVDAMGCRERRFDFLARLVRAVPVRRLVYPSGVDRLPEAGQAILDDLSGLQPLHLVA